MWLIKTIPYIIYPTKYFRLFKWYHMPRKDRSRPDLKVLTYTISTVSHISPGTFWFQYALIEFFEVDLLFPINTQNILRWFKGRANHELSIYYLNFNPTEWILCLKHERKNKRFRSVGTQTFAAECTWGHISSFT